jgi:hypothetical protein
MILHVWTVVCSHSVTDKKTNNVSLQNVIEQINYKAPPDWPESSDGDVSIWFPFEVVSLWTRSEPDEPVTGVARLVIHRPSGRTMASPELEVRLENRRRRRTQFSFQGFPIDVPGYIWFAVELQCPVGSEWRTVARVPVEMREVPPEEDSEGDNGG